MARRTPAVSCPFTRLWDQDTAQDTSLFLPPLTSGLSPPPPSPSLLSCPLPLLPHPLLPLLLLSCPFLLFRESSDLVLSLPKGQRGCPLDRALCLFSLSSFDDCGQDPEAGSGRKSRCGPQVLAWGAAQMEGKPSPHPGASPRPEPWVLAGHPHAEQGRGSLGS